MYKNIIIWTQSSFGLGHLVMAARFASQLKDSRIVIAYGGPKIKGIDLHNHEIVYLPALVDNEMDRKKIVSLSKSSVAHIQKMRRVILKRLCDKIKPDAIITEHFPFGKTNFRDEVLGLLNYAKKQYGTRGIGLTRDVICHSFDDQKKYLERVKNDVNFYDYFLVGSDIKIFDFSEEFPFIDKSKLFHIGYIHENSDVIVTGGDTLKKSVFVSVGGGKDGIEIIRKVINAASNFENNFIISAGSEKSYLQIKKSVDLESLPNVVLQPFVDSQLYVNLCDYFISMGGYNSVVEIVKSGKPCLFVPRVTDKEQIARVKRFSELFGYQYVLPSADIELITSKIKGMLLEQKKPRKFSFFDSKELTVFNQETYQRMYSNFEKESEDKLGINSILSFNKGFVDSLLGNPSIPLIDISTNDLVKQLRFENELLNNNSAQERISKNVASLLYSYPIVTPDNIALSVSSRCNTKCRICNSWMHEREHDLLLDNEYITILDQIKKWSPETLVDICGPEPLVKSDLVIKLIDYAHQIKLTTGLITNGIALNTNIVESIINKGMKYIVVSLDGATAKTHDYVRNVDGAFDRIIQNLRDAVSLKKKHSSKTSIAVSCVINGRNLSEIIDLIELCEKIGIDSIDFNPYLPSNSFFNNQNLEKDEFWIKEKQLDELNEVIEKIILIKKDNTRISIPRSETRLRSNIPYFKDMGKYQKEQAGLCTSGYNYFNINCEGYVSVCEKGPYLNVRDKQLSEIWKSYPFWLTRLKAKICQKGCIDGCYKKFNKNLELF